ncbi:partial putative type I restriction enzymeP M protein, partial [Anaerolineae bacterium]
MTQLEHIEAIEKRLWNAADTLRANSNYASNEYFLPVMGLIFLRHAYCRFLAVKDDIEANLPKRGGKTRPLTKEDFSQKNAIFLQPKAQFDYLVSLKDGDVRADAIIKAMESIENDYKSLSGILPKSEYQELDNEVLGQLIRKLNPDELKRVSGDVFGRIYEYFLTQFADQKAHDGGEFFTPVSLVSLIANVLEPQGGTVLDPACGSGGMFVQSARFVERQHEIARNKLTFRGLEKNATTIRLAKMNLAVHGLEGDIQKAITYYDDPLELLGKADFVMANPPFNVDEIDADKVKNDPRLPFGLPGVNKKGKVSNGNYIWISYFYSYLGETGRAGFVMSSQASSAGRDEGKVRQKLVETGDVELMVAIRPNFFYTRTVTCELWFLNRAKPDKHRSKVLMIDARNIYRKVTRKIYDFSPEQEQNILAIVWLYRGQTDKYLELVAGYCHRMLNEGTACFSGKDDDGEAIEPLPAFTASLDALLDAIQPFLKTLAKDAAHAEILKELNDAL